MANTDSLQILKEILELKQQVSVLNHNLVPTWQKDLQAFSPLIGALMGLVIALTLFYLNKKKDEKKEINDMHKNIYGEMNRLVYTVLNQLGLSEYHKIYSNHFYASSRIQIINKEELKTKGDESFNKYLIVQEKSVETLSKISELMNVYLFINPKSKILDIYKELIKNDFSYDTENKFDDVLDAHDIRHIRDCLLSESSSYINNIIRPKFFEMLECIKNEKIII